MLTSFEKMSGDKLQRYEYSYDKDGLRTVKKYFEDGILQTVTTYLWKDGKLLGANVIDENGSILMTVKYIYDGEELVAIDLNGSVLLVEKNLQGDITSLYDVENDQKLFDFYYDAYGKMSVSQEDSFIVTIVKALIVAYTNVTYRGYYYDFDTGLYYLQSRYYDPQTGRFISLDDTQIAIFSVGDPLGLNLYAYCDNNPVNNSDETGMVAVVDDILFSYLTCIVISVVTTAVFSQVSNRYTSLPGFKNDWATIPKILLSCAYNQATKITKAANIVYSWAKVKLSTAAQAIKVAVSATIADAKIRSQVKKNSKTRYWSATVGTNCVDIGRKLTYNEALNMVKSGKSVFTVTKAEAKALAKAAYSNKTPKGPEIHDKKDGKKKSGFYYWHFHVYKEKLKGHIWYLY